MKIIVTLIFYVIAEVVIMQSDVDTEDERSRRAQQPKPDIEADPDAGVGGPDIRIDEEHGVGGPDIKPEQSG